MNAATLLTSVMDDPETRRPLLALMRAAVTEPEAADLIRQLLTERMLLPMAQHVGGARPELRASLMAASLVGVVMVRHVVRIEPLAQASREQLIQAIVPVFEHYLHGDWVDGG
jgi:Tetracyclin repressor-like, C-terminal domain